MPFDEQDLLPELLSRRLTLRHVQIDGGIGRAEHPFGRRTVLLETGIVAEDVVPVVLTVAPG